MSDNSLTGRNQLHKAKDVKVGDHIFNNRADYWLNQWAVVTKVETISAGNIAITTAQRLFVAKPDQLVLLRDMS